MVVDNDRAERFDGGFESLRDFLRFQFSDFTGFTGHVYQVFRQPFPLIRFDDLHSIFGFRPEHADFIIEGVKAFESGIGFLSAFVKLRYCDQEVVRVFRVADIESEDPASSGIAVDFQHDVPPDSVFAFEKVSETCGVRFFRYEGKRHVRNMGIAAAHFPPIRGKTLGSEKIETEIVREEHLDVESGRQVGLEKREVFLFDSFDPGEEYFRTVFKTFVFVFSSVPEIRSLFRDVDVWRGYRTEFFRRGQPFGENVKRIHRTGREFPVRHYVGFEVAKHGIIPVAIILAHFGEAFF